MVALLSILVALIHNIIESAQVAIEIRSHSLSMALQRIIFTMI